jgi:Ser/Thr protein kinase RdoA (MazF antagonist)
MKHYVIERFSGDIATQAARRWDIEPDQLKDLGGFESFVYEADIRGDEAILKIGHSDRRSAELLVAEADFTRFLAGRGIPVASAIESTGGHLVESIDDGAGAHFMATAWTKAHGRPPSRECLDPAFWFAHGRLLGEIHAASREYRPTGRLRPSWDEPIFLEDSLHIPESDHVGIAIRDSLLTELRSLPTTDGAYGLVHHDAHGGNVMYDGTQVTLFDFDDCGYNWFANDLAIVMYYGLLAFEDPAEAARTIWPTFIAGYQDRHRIEAHWFELFPQFLAWRDVLLLSVLHRSRDSITDIDVGAWIERFHARHTDNRPLVAFDFTTAVR